MQESLLEALFKGEIAPWMRPASSEARYRERRERIKREQRYFGEKLGREDRNRLEELWDLYMGAAYDEEVDIYTHGFVLGALLMVEVMEKRDIVVNGPIS